MDAHAGGPPARPLTRRRAWVVVLMGVTVLTFGGACRKKETAKARESIGRIVQALKKMGRAKDADKVKRTCAGAGARSCACTLTAAQLALDQDLGKEALAVLEGAPKSCPVQGQRAEALARVRRLSAAEQQARAALAASPQDPHATYALAHVQYVRGRTPAVLSLARQAIERGRGGAAHLLIGLIHFRERKYLEAKRSFDAMLVLDPQDATALYNVALVHHQRKRYRLAREGYLKALRSNARLANARFNLVVLTHGAGAVAEARHHLKKFAALVPGDARIARLQALLRRAPVRPRPGPGRPPMGPSGTVRNAAPNPGRAPSPGMAPTMRVGAPVMGQRGPVGPGTGR